MHNINSQYNLPELGKQLADKANRDGVAERFEDPAGQSTIEVDLALITVDDELLKDLELSSLKTAKHHNANPLYLLQTGPGLGRIFSLVLRYEPHQIERFPSGQHFTSYARLVKCHKESAGKQIGTAHLTRAFSGAAPLFLRNHPQAQQRLARLEKTPAQGKALSILAHKLGRAVYRVLKRKVACAMDILLQT